MNFAGALIAAVTGQGRSVPRTPYRSREMELITQATDDTDDTQDGATP
jgi:hypothetical protein